MTTDSKLAQDVATLTESAREAAWRLFSQGPLPSTALTPQVSGREWLIREGYAEATPQGWVFMTRAGVDLAVVLGMNSRKTRMIAR